MMARLPARFSVLSALLPEDLLWQICFRELWDSWREGLHARARAARIIQDLARYGPLPALMPAESQQIDPSLMQHNPWMWQWDDVYLGADGPIEEID